MIFRKNRSSSSSLSSSSSDDWCSSSKPIVIRKAKSSNNSNNNKEETRSKSVPIPSTIRRTPSEVQLHEDEQVAEYRDYCMYVRLVNGMNEKKCGCGCYYHQCTEQSLANIIRTRHLPLEQPHQQQQLYQDPFANTDWYDFEDEGVFVLDM